MDRHPGHNANLLLVQGSTRSVDLPNSAGSSFSASGSSMDAILGPVPSQLEVESAIASLQAFISQSSQLEQQNEQRASSSNGHTKVEEAFHLLQSDPAIQKVVAALATDKAVWDAVKKNEMVLKLREHRTTPAVESFRFQSCETEEAAESADEAKKKHWVRRMMDIASMITELIQKWQSIMHVLSTLFDKGSYDGGPAKSADQLQQQLLMDQRIGTPLLLAVVTLLIVVVERA